MGKRYTYYKVRSASIPGTALLYACIFFSVRKYSTPLSGLYGQAVLTYGRGRRVVEQSNNKMTSGALFSPATVSGLPTPHTATLHLHLTPSPPPRLPPPPPPPPPLRSPRTPQLPAFSTHRTPNQHAISHHHPRRWCWAGQLR